MGMDVKNYGVWIRYNSRSGTHNMFREYRACRLVDAVAEMYSEMAGLHRARFRSIQIIRTSVLTNEECKRPKNLQFHKEGLKFPLPHRILRAPSKAKKSKFSGSRP